MKPLHILAAAAILSVAGAAPALADWDRIGSVDVDFHRDHDRVYTDFGGSIERLELRAENSAVQCRSVRATFGNGNTRQIFSGRLPRDRNVDIDLPGRARDVKRLDFSCVSMRPRGATISIFADVGRYRDEWRHSPNWDRMWSHTFHWGMGGGMRDDTTNNWVTLGSESFEGRNDSESSFGGWRGHSVDRIALRPDVDARCTRVTARFGNGQTRDLNIDGHDLLRAGEVRRLDLPGGDRNIVRLDLRCHAEHDFRVRIDILARK